MTNGAAPYDAGAKDLPDNAIRKSVIDPQTQVLQQPGFADAIALDPSSALFFMAARSDGLRAWGSAPSLRDRQLRQLLPLEPFTMSAIATCCATNMGLSWTLDGPGSTVQRVQDMLHQADFGEGIETWTARMSLDYYTQDKGAVSELVRDEDNPRSPVIGINHLDIARGWHTGNPEIPFLYQDRLGRWHAMKWYQVVKAAELPAAHEQLYGLQYCALTRILGITQIIRNIIQLLDEKSGGRHTRTVHIISGIRKGDIETAMRIAQQSADESGLLRYIQPVIVPTIDPTADPKLTSIALADLPDNFSEHLDDWFKWFLSAIAMGLLRDYQDFAPLPGGGLGTGSQSEILHLKSRGKGPAIWQRKIEHLFNFNGVVPRNVTFKYDEQDLEEEDATAKIFSTYATAYSALAACGALDAPGIRQLMVDNKMIPIELFDALNARDLTRDQTVGDNMRVQGDTPATGVGQPDGTVLPDTAPANVAPNSNVGRTEVGERGMTIEFTDERGEVEEGLTKTAQRALDVLGRDVRRALTKVQR